MGLADGEGGRGEGREGGRGALRGVGSVSVCVWGGAMRHDVLWTEVDDRSQVDDSCVAIGWNRCRCAGLRLCRAAAARPAQRAGAGGGGYAAGASCVMRLHARTPADEGAPVPLAPTVCAWPPVKLVLASLAPKRSAYCCCTAGRMVAVTRYKMPCGLPPSASYDEYAAAVIPPDPVTEVPLNPLNPTSFKVGWARLWGPHEGCVVSG